MRYLIGSIVVLMVTAAIGCKRRSPPKVNIDSNPPASNPYQPPPAPIVEPSPSVEEGYSQLILQGVLENGDQVSLGQNVVVSVQPTNAGTQGSTDSYTGPVSEKLNFKSGFSYRIEMKVYEDNFLAYNSVNCRENPDDFALKDKQVLIRIQLCPVEVAEDKASVEIKPILKKPDSSEEGSEVID